MHTAFDAQSLSPAITVVVVLLVLYRILSQQLTWRPLARLLRLGAILAVLGVVSIGTTVGTGHLSVPHSTTVLLVALMLVTSAIGGLALGFVSRARTAADGTVTIRGGGLGIAVWVVVIALRIGESVLVSVFAPELAALSGGLLLLSIGLLRLLSAGVAGLRARRAAAGDHGLHATAVAPRPTW
ncbi:hypothetical protein ACT3TZ_08720 [Brachybacterium sp. AOP25-B2-12]|uniref:hypothetical protein n=1 Tax=Brachybacterium sp. AOP25-B2-12 TaxID=3457710 RepID=UPI0040348DE6